MIEGIKLVVSHKELQDHLLRRIEYHHEKVSWYEKQIGGLEAGGLSSSFRENSARNSVEDPVRSLKGKADEHGQKADVFAFIRAHLQEDDYELSEQDLGRLEFIKNSRFGLGW